MLADRYRELDSDISFSITGTAGREFLSRTSAQVIRYHWASKMISLEIGRQVEADPAFAALLPDFTAQNVQGCIDVALNYHALTALVTPPDTPAWRWRGTWRPRPVRFVITRS